MDWCLLWKNENLDILAQRGATPVNKQYSLYPEETEPEDLTKIGLVPDYKKLGLL